ncbi:MAG: glycosyltransferase, partial [Acidimicrobiales bacterium]
MAPFTPADPMRVLVVLPTYNESENIERVLGRVRRALPEGGVLVVDDGSPDGTADIAERINK